MPQRVAKFQITLAWLSIILIAGCVSGPNENIVITQRNDGIRYFRASPCDVNEESLSPPGGPDPGTVLNKDGFTLAVWNMLKGTREGWQSDLTRLMATNNLLVIQEAHLSDELQDLLLLQEFNWDMVIAFNLHGIPVGVLTASTVQPRVLCAQKSKEPVLRTPKTILITLYPLSDTNQQLMVVNLHLINFTTGLSRFQSQLKKIDQIISNHIGPGILTGDFNTWSDQRLHMVETYTNHLGLQPVGFEKENRRKFLGNFVDHIYYRDIDIQEARVISVISSDHNPMVVRFRVNAKK